MDSYLTMAKFCGYVTSRFQGGCEPEKDDVRDDDAISFGKEWSEPGINYAGPTVKVAKLGQLHQEITDKLGRKSNVSKCTMSRP